MKYPRKLPSALTAARRLKSRNPKPAKTTAAAMKTNAPAAADVKRQKPKKRQPRHADAVAAATKKPRKGLKQQKLLKNAATLTKTARTTQKTAQTNNNTKEVCIERYVPFFLSVFFGLTLDKGGRL